MLPKDIVSVLSNIGMTNPPPPVMTLFFIPVTTIALSCGTFFHIRKITVKTAKPAITATTVIIIGVKSNIDVNKTILIPPF
jgi:hypothetical protein